MVSEERALTLGKLLQKDWLDANMLHPESAGAFGTTFSDPPTFPLATKPKEKQGLWLIGNSKKILKGEIGATFYSFKEKASYPQKLLSF